MKPRFKICWSKCSKGSFFLFPLNYNAETIYLRKHVWPYSGDYEVPRIYKQ